MKKFLTQEVSKRFATVQIVIAVAMAIAIPNALLSAFG